MYEDMTVVGNGIPLKEGYAKVTGSLKLAPDRGVRGGLWMKILRSPHAHARIKSIDVRKAEALAGVVAVITHRDVPQKELTCRIFNWRGKILDDRVRFVGDEVAAVAAETAEIAKKALRRIKVEYEKLAPVFDIEAALKPDAPDVRGVGTNQVCCPPEPGTLPSSQGWGDIAQASGDGGATVEHEIRTQPIYGSFMTPACIAQWEGNKLTIMLSHQCPYDVRRATADVLDIPENRVRIIAPMVAGTFGMLNSSQRFYHLAALLSRKAERPVIYKMTIEEYGVYKSREGDIVRTTMGGQQDGTVTALDYRQLHDNGGYGFKGTTYQSQHEIFKYASVRYNATGVATNKLSTGCIRGVGNVPQCMALNQTFDRLMEKLDLDPLTMWKKNHYRAGDPLGGGRVPGNVLSSDAFDELIDKGAEAIGWKEKWQGWGKPYRTNGVKKRGVGMALALLTAGLTPLPASARVQINHDGTAHVLAGSMDIGTGCKTAYAQICAEALGFKVEDVYLVRDVDTESVPFSCLTGASTSLFIEGSAAKLAAEDAKAQLLEMASTAPWSPDALKQGVKSPDELDIKDNVIYVKKDPGRCCAVRELVSSVLAPIVIGSAYRHGVSHIGPQPKATMAGFADVEVDTKTGKVTVLKLVLGHDSGRIINPQTSENQVFGGALMSLGYGLMEEVTFDSKTGKPLNPALSDYSLPTALDAPAMEIIFSENIDPIGPFGAKGLGEAPSVYPHAAIAGAIYNAIGVRLSELPITPQKVLYALRKRDKSEAKS